MTDEQLVCCGMFPGKLLSYRNLEVQASTPISSVFVYIRNINVDYIPPPAGGRGTCSPFILLLGHRPLQCDSLHPEAVYVV